MTKKYFYKYKLTIEHNNKNGFREDEIKTINEEYKRENVCDGLFVVSVVRNSIDECGYNLSYSFSCTSLKDEELFSLWESLAETLTERPNLTIQMKKICANVVKQGKQIKQQQNAFKDGVQLLFPSQRGQK